MVTDLYVISLINRGSIAYCVCKLPSNISEMLSESHTIKKCDFLKPILHSPIIQMFLSYSTSLLAGKKNDATSFELGCRVMTLH